MPSSFEAISAFEHLEKGKSLFFASDFHLGAPNEQASAEREKKIITWLDTIKDEAAAIFLVGDIFDFWFEYKKVIPKGFTRFQAKLLDLRTEGVPIYFFTGNHDAWMFDYFPDQFDIPVFKRPVILHVEGKKLFVGHGDGLGPGDRFYKLLKKIFEGRFPQWLFRWIHPDIGVALAHAWSKNSRVSNNDKDEGFISKEKEWLWHYAKDMEEEVHHDFYIFGHRHIPLDLKVGNHARYLNLGEWINHYTYVKYDGQNAQLLTFTHQPA